MKPNETLAIVGVGHTHFKRKHELGLDALVVQSARRAIADSGLDPSEIDGVVLPQRQPAADQIAIACGIRNRRHLAISAYTPGAGAVAALLEAQLAIRAGLASAVLVAYGILTSRPGGPYEFHAEDPLKADLEMPVGYYGQPLYFGGIAQRYRHEFGLEPEQLGSLAVAQREWAARTPGAQKPDRITMSDYLAAPLVAEPLRTLDCCLITDGAGAYVVTTLDRARDLPQPPAVVRAITAGSNPWTLTEMFTQSPRFLDLVPPDSSRRAFAEAGITPADVDVAQVYDCFTMSIVLQLEGLGFCGRGEGAEFVAGGRTGPGGALPVNTSGGHLSHAYIPGVTLVTEAVRQVRGDGGEAQVPDAEVCLVSSFGGPDHATLILSSE